MFTRRSLILRLLAVSFLVIFATFMVVQQPTMAEKNLFTGKENHVVDLQSAQRWTSFFQESMKPGDVIAGYMSRDIFQRILAQEGCVGIRIYNAKMDDKRSTFVIVGVDGKGNDIVGGVIGENITPCPPWCATETTDLLPRKEAVAMAK